MRGASPPQRMNLRSDRDLCRTSAHFVGRNQLGDSLDLNGSESGNGPGKGLLGLRETAPEVDDASKAPSPKLGNTEHVSPYGATNMCHSDIRRARK
jgi:hypothetical protein